MPANSAAGLAQVIEIANREKTPFIISAATFDRIHNPAQGREGGRLRGEGAAKRVSEAGMRSPTRAITSCRPGDSLVSNYRAAAVSATPGSVTASAWRPIPMESPAGARADYGWRE